MTKTTDSQQQHLQQLQYFERLAQNPYLALLLSLLSPHIAPIVTTTVSTFATN